MENESENPLNYNDDGWWTNYCDEQNKKEEDNKKEEKKEEEEEKKIAMQPILTDNYIRALTGAAIKRAGIKLDNFLNTRGDLLSVAWPALQRARDTWDESMNVKFSSYAIICAANAIKQWATQRHNAFGPTPIRGHRTYQKLPMGDNNEIPSWEGLEVGYTEIDTLAIDIDLLFADLSDHERQAIKLWLDGHTWEELAKIRLGKTTAKAAAQYALRKLRARYNNVPFRGQPATGGQRFSSS